MRRMKTKHRMEENISDSKTKNSGGPWWTVERMEGSDTRGLRAGVEELWGELEEGGLEQVGGCPWEVDVPHNEEGCTPLIIACQRGLTEVIHFLLRKGADVTLCNHANQTALHVSPPVLQEVLLSAMFRPLPHRMQLLQAAWLGDLHTLQHLLARTDPVDVNTQNRNGLTPLMLAVRDADLFEGLDNRLPWEYRPVEVVGELLALSADIGVRDVNGYSALHYAAKIQSPIKDEFIIMMAESLRQPVTLDLWFFHPDDALQVNFPSPSTSLIPGFLIQSAASIENALESSACVHLLHHHEDNSQDKGLSLGFQNTMDTLRDTRPAYQELRQGGSRGSSLPSLWHRGRHLGKPDSAVGMLKTKGGHRFPHAPPRLRGGCDVVAPPQVQLSQSAPTLTDPALDSSSVVQARVHIQNRLGCGETEKSCCGETEKSSYGPKGSFPALRPGPIRNPKLLAPIEGRHSAGGVLPGLKHHSPLKPINLLPLSSMPSRTSRLRRERLSRTTVSPRGESEESGCSSTSSQSSVDLEEEDEQNWRDMRDSTAKQHSGEERLHLDLQTVDSPHKAIEIRHRLIPDLLNFKDVNSSLWFERDCEEIVSVERTTCSGLVKETTRTEPTITCTFTPKQHGNKDTEVNDKNENTSGVNITNYQCLPSPVKVLLCELNLPTREKIKATKQNKIIKKRSSTSVQNKTNQSFNILADKEHIRGKSKSSKNVRALSVPSHYIANVRKPTEVIIGGEATVKSRIIPPKTGQRSTDSSSLRIRNTEPSCQSHKKLNYNRKTTSEPCHKPSEQREPKCTRQPLKTGEIQYTPRSKSVIDSVTYSDMFREIDIGVDQGPVIYEMFAGPVFDNIRVSRSKGCERNRQVQSAQSRNAQTHRPKRKCPKPLESNRQRRSPVDKVVSTKGKQRKNQTVRSISRGMSSLTPIDITNDKDKSAASSGLNWHIHPQAKTDQVHSRDEKEAVVAEEHTLSLSVIEEVLSSHASDTLIHQWQPDEKNSLSQTKTNVTSHFDRDDDSLCVQQNRESNENNRSGSGHNHWKANHQDHSSALSCSPSQPKINTWTSASCDSMSPVFQKFLDGVGEGPLTEELLKCLAEELISLDERESMSLCPENRSDKESKSKNNSAPRQGKSFPGDVISPGGLLSESMLQMNDAITWTKGEVLGRGAYGTVFCGLTSRGQLIAVKQVALDTTDLDTANKEYSRLQQEVDLLKNLSHSNIVGFLGTSFRENVVNIFMEYVPGGSIASVLHRFGPLPERILALYTRQVLEGVSYLHLNRVIHRDLKGNNLMLMPTGVVKLIDFGCARRLSCLTHTKSRSDLLKSVHGTPYWMAPEVINETGHGRKSDIWSVGCTVFEMATGKPPLSHMNKMAALFYIGARRGIMPSLPGAFSAEAREFVQVCLTSDQKQRPTAEQLLDHPFITKEDVILV